MPKNKNILPIFPIPEIVMFPEMNLPLHIFEERYKQLVSDCLKASKKFGIVLAKENDIYAKIGTVVEIVDVENLEEGMVNIFTEGRERFEIINFITEEPYHVAEIKSYEDIDTEVDDELKSSFKKIKQLASKALKTFDLISEEENSRKIKLPGKPDELLFLIATNLTCSHDEKQIILETRSIRDRVERIMPLLNEELKKLEILLENKNTKKDVEKNGKLKIH